MAFDSTVGVFPDRRLQLFAIRVPPSECDALKIFHLTCCLVVLIPPQMNSDRIGRCFPLENAILEFFWQVFDAAFHGLLPFFFGYHCLTHASGHSVKQWLP